MIKQVNKYFCDFCGADEDKAEDMAITESGVAICSNCIKTAMKMTSEREKARLAKESGENLR